MERVDAQSIVFQPVFIRMLQADRWLERKRSSASLNFEKQIVMFEKSKQVFSTDNNDTDCPNLQFELSVQSWASIQKMLKGICLLQKFCFYRRVRVWYYSLKRSPNKAWEGISYWLTKRLLGISALYFLLNNYPHKLICFWLHKLFKVS